MSTPETVTVTVTYKFDFSLAEWGESDDPVGMVTGETLSMFDCVGTEPFEVKVETT